MKMTLFRTANIRKMMLLAVIGASAITAQAAGTIISINVNEASGRRPMTSTDLAGVGDYRVANWNNVNAGASVSVTGSSLVFNDGSAVDTNFEATFNLRAASAAAVTPTPINDAQLYSGFSDLRAAGHSITLSNIPFSNYAIYVYVNATVATRGGSVSLGSETYYVRGVSTIPADTGTGYVQATTTTYNVASPTSVGSGNYVLFGNLSGATQSISLAALDMGDSVNLRFNISGIQIVSLPPTNVPEPSSYAALAGATGLIFVALFRRRTKA